MTETEKHRSVVPGIVKAMLIASLLLFSAAVVLVGTETSEEESSSATLRIGFTEKIDSLNVLVGLSDTANIFFSLTYDSLLSIGNDFETTNNLATSTRIVPEEDPALLSSGEPYGSVWEYDVTRNAAWHDGVDFTVDDVVFTVNAQCMGNNFPIFWRNQPCTYYIQYAEKVDDDTVRIHFYNRSTGEPVPFASGNFLFVPILPEHLGEWWSVIDNPEWGPTHPPLVGTGPFMVTEEVYDEYEQGKPITLVKNPNHHFGVDQAKEVVGIDKISLRFYSDFAEMYGAIKDGELDLAKIPMGFQIVGTGSILDTMENVETVVGPRCDGYFTGVVTNMRNESHNLSRLDLSIRQAMAMSTNKTHILQNYYHGLGEEGSTLVAPINSDWHYYLAEGETYEYDSGAAKALLESAGYRDADGDGVREAAADSWSVRQGLVEKGTPLRYEMLVVRNSLEEDVAHYIDSMWEDVGIDLTITPLDEVALSISVYSYDYDMAIWWWSQDPCPNFILFGQSKKAWYGWSENLYFNPAYEANYTESVVALDFLDRKAHVDNCQRIYYRDAAAIVLAYPYQSYAMRNDTFVGWGDWEARPGRTLDAKWGGNPLWFDLRPVSLEEKAKVSLWPILGISGAVAAASAIVLLVLWRRRSKT